MPALPRPLSSNYNSMTSCSRSPNNVWADSVAMGNVLADYEDGGGVVVVGNHAWANDGGWLLQGRWMTGGYSPYDSTGQFNFSLNTANIIDPSHPLMQGVSSLTALWREGVPLASGASAVAMWTDGPPAVAYKTNNGRTAVGINAWLGHTNEFAGAWGRVIVNAGRWLLPVRWYTNADTHGYANCHTNRNSNTYSECDRKSNCHTYRYSYADCDTDAHRYADSYSHCEPDAHRHSYTRRVCYRRSLLEKPRAVAGKSIAAWQPHL